MKRQILVVTIFTLLLSASAIFGQKIGDSKIGDSKIATAAKISIKKLEESALAYLKGILEEDEEEIFKFIHPAVIKEAGGKNELLKVIKTELKIYKDEKVLFNNFGIAEVKIKSSNSTIPIEAIIKIPEGEVSFEGLLKGKLEYGKWYFFNKDNESLIESLGLKDPNEDEAT